MPQEVIEHEGERPAALQQRSHHPHVQAAASGLRLAVRNQIACGYREQENAVEICVDGWLGKGDAEELREERPSASIATLTRAS